MLRDLPDRGPAVIAAHTLRGFGRVNVDRATARERVARSLQLRLVALMQSRFGGDEEEAQLLTQRIQLRELSPRHLDVHLGFEGCADLATLTRVLKLLEHAGAQGDELVPIDSV